MGVDSNSSVIVFEDGCQSSDIRHGFYLFYIVGVSFETHFFCVTDCCVCFAFATNETFDDDDATEMGMDVFMMELGTTSYTVY